MVKLVTLKEAWDGKADCKTCTIRESVLFAGLPEEVFEKLHEPIDQYTLPVGATLYHAGDEGDKLYTVRTGVLKLVQYLQDGSQRIVRLIRSTDITGLECLLGSNYHHDAVVLQETEVCGLPVKVVDNLSKEYPNLHRELLNRWQRALNEADAWLTELSTGSSKQRIARLLLRLTRDTHTSECQLFAREDIGAMLGITTETASRTIAEFKRQSLLVESQPNHFLLDIPNLQRIADD